MNLLVQALAWAALEIEQLLRSGYPTEGTATSWRWDKVVAVVQGPEIPTVSDEGQNFRAILVFSEGARVLTNLTVYKAEQMLDYFTKCGKLP